MEAKTVTIVNAQNGQETEVRLAERVTPLAIFTQLGLGYPEQYRLARVANRHVFDPSSDVSQAVKEGERLFVFAAIQVGRILWQD